MYVLYVQTARTVTICNFTIHDLRVLYPKSCGRVTGLLQNVRLVFELSRLHSSPKILHKPKC